MITRFGNTIFRHKFAALAFDGFAAALAFYLALNFSFGRGLVLVDLKQFWDAVAYTSLFAIIAIAMAYIHGLHRSVWRYASLIDFINILRTTTLTVLLFVPIAFLTARGDSLPRSTPFIAWFLMSAFIGGPRILARTWTDRRTPRPLSAALRRRTETSVPVLIVGTGARIEIFVRELHRQNDPAYVVVGILTYETEWHGRLIHGVGVLGGANDVANAKTFLAQRGIKPQRLIIADDKADEALVSKFLEIATQQGLVLGRLPRLTDFGSTGDNGGKIQPVAISDLLGRPQVQLDRDGMRNLVAQKRVLVTGAGGSIGSELVRQICGFKPSRIVLVENSEFNLYSIDKEVSENFPDVSRREILCDVQDRGAVQRTFEDERPEIVFHAAALKHVPLAESNPLQTMRTNIVGTQNVADACALRGVNTMVLISTDKAVNPSNVMGATKRFAESYCQAMDASGCHTRFVAVRFGNVLGSAGSVVPLFQRQLAAGGPITVTHPDITRYFMTIPEAVQLVLQASALGARAEAARAAVYVLDMGKPIRIVDLARQMIRLSGKKPDIDIKIEFIGLRPGEKLYEELVHENEQQEKTTADGVMIVSPRTSELPILRQLVLEFLKAADGFDETRGLRLLKVMVPEFQYEEVRMQVLTTPAE